MAEHKLPIVRDGLGAQLPKRAARAPPWLAGRGRRSTLERPAPPHDEPTSRVTELRQQLRNQLRAIVAKINHFQGYRYECDRPALDELVASVVDDMRACFSTAAALRVTGVAITASHARCLNDLENFLCGLRAEPALSSLELAHAMDDLLVHCVMLDAEQREAWPGHARPRRR